MVVLRYRLVHDGDYHVRDHDHGLVRNHHIDVSGTLELICEGEVFVICSSPVDVVPVIAFVDSVPVHVHAVFNLGDGFRMGCETVTVRPAYGDVQIIHGGEIVNVVLTQIVQSDLG